MLLKHIFIVMVDFFFCSVPKVSSCRLLIPRHQSQSVFSHKFTAGGIPDLRIRLKKNPDSVRIIWLVGSGPVYVAGRIGLYGESNPDTVYMADRIGLYDW